MSPARTQAVVRWVRRHSLLLCAARRIGGRRKARVVGQSDGGHVCARRPPSGIRSQTDGRSDRSRTHHPQDCHGLCTTIRQKPVLLARFPGCWCEVSPEPRRLRPTPVRSRARRGGSAPDGHPGRPTMAGRKHVPPAGARAYPSAAADASRRVSQEPGPRPPALERGISVCRGPGCGEPGLHGGRSRHVRNTPCSTGAGRSPELQRGAPGGLKPSGNCRVNAGLRRERAAVPPLGSLLQGRPAAAGGSADR
jgi:hypothetical protein